MTSISDTDASRGLRQSLPWRPCAGVMMVNTEGLIFAGERIDTPGAWQMPQGGIDPGESALDAALRELTEETSVPASAVTVEAVTDDWITYDLPDSLLGKAWGGQYRGQRMRWARVRFDGPESLINLATAHPEFSRWQWMDKDALMKAIVPFKRDLYRRVVTALAP